MSIRVLRSRLYRLDPADPVKPIYLGGYYIRIRGLPDACFRAAAAALFALALAALAAGEISPCTAAAYVPCVRGLFAALFMPRILREDDFAASVRRIRLAGLIGALLALRDAPAAAAALLCAAMLALRQRYLLQKEATS